MAADFDRLPLTFGTFEEFRGYLAAQYPSALVLPTPSGRAKLIYKVLDNDSHGPDRKVNGPRARAVRKLVGPELSLFIDIAVAATHLVFLT